MNTVSKSILITGWLLVVQGALAQNIGIGTHTPVEKLDLQGAIRIGNTTGTNAGTIRWNPDRKDFEGYTGSAWVSLTGSQGNWGRQPATSLEDFGSLFSLHTCGAVHGRGLGQSLDLHSEFLIAGAPEDCAAGGLSNAGTVYLIRRHQGEWRDYPDYEVQAPVPAALEYFGRSVSMESPYMVVGAPGWNQQRGKIYIYEIPAGGGSPLFVSSFSQGDAAASDGFGSAVCIHGEFIMAGAPYKDINGAMSQGQVTIFRFNIPTQSWNLMQTMQHPEPQANAIFGSCIRIDGNRAAVAAPFQDIDTLSDAGKVFLYAFNGVTWAYQQALEAPDPGKDDKFGTSLALRGDTLLVGAIETDVFNQAAYGKVYVYLRSGQQWVYHSMIGPPDGKAGQWFGSSVDFRNGTVVIGSSRARIGLAEDAGLAYVFTLSGGQWVHQTTLSNSVAQASDRFGAAVRMDDQSIVVSAPDALFVDGQSNGRLFYYYK